MSVAEVAQSFEPGFWDVDAETYHADWECVSNSQLGDFKESPALYYGRHLTGAFPPKESSGFDIGTVFHDVALLEDQSRVVIIPQDVLAKNGAKNTNAYRDFEADHEGMILLKADEFAAIDRMIQSVRRHDDANHLAFALSGRNEQPIRWECPITGIWRRAMLDRILDRGVICDLKSTTNASPYAFAKTALDNGYHRQAATYQEAVEQITGKLMRFFFVVVEKAPPYRCEVFELREDFMEMGREENRRLMQDLAECRESGRWETKTHGKIVTIQAPAYARSQIEWEAS